MIFFTSDQHFGHFNVIKYCKRPFSSVEEMNEEMVRLHNETVGPEDTVFMLGDFSLSKTAMQAYAPRLNGTKYLIMGNHDHCHPIHYKSNEEKGERLKQLYRDSGFSTVVERASFSIADEMVQLHHMPYKGDHTEGERFAKFRPTNEGGWLLHGHVHDLWKIKDKQINVGVDVWDFKPVSITQIEEIIRGVK